MRDAAKLISFLVEAFGSKMISSHKKPNGSIGNAELRVYDSVVMVGDAGIDTTNTSSLYLYVVDVDEVYENAIKAGGKSIQKPTDMVYGNQLIDIVQKIIIAIIYV